jgi:REP element-mobilizing transposase RayT
VARPLRIETAGGWYHVTARGNERKPIFRDDADRRHFLEAVAEMVRRFRVCLHCFVLMDNHYHLLLELREPNLPVIGVTRKPACDWDLSCTIAAKPTGTDKRFVV